MTELSELTPMLSARRYARILRESCLELANSETFAQIVGSLRARRLISEFVGTMNPVDKIAVFEFNEVWLNHVIIKALEAQGLQDANRHDVDEVRDSLIETLSEKFDMEINMWDDPVRGWIIWDDKTVSESLKNAGWPEELEEGKDYVPPLRSPPRAYDANEHLKG